MRGNEENAKTLRNLNDEGRAVAQRQERRRHHICEENGLCCSIKKILKRILACIKNCFCCWGCCSQCCTDKQQSTEDEIEEDLKNSESRYFPIRCILAWSGSGGSTQSRTE